MTADASGSSGSSVPGRAKAAGAVAGAARGRGRPPGRSDTRASILRAARERFAATGFGGTTIRAIARDAGVDPALVHHYFGSKDELFVASLELPVDPREVLAQRLSEDGGAGTAVPGERLLRAMLSVWDDPELRPGLLAGVRRLLEPGGEDLIRTGFVPVVLRPMGELLGVDRPERRMPLVATQVIGMVLARYVIVLEPVCSMSVDELVSVFAPTLERYLTEDLDGA